MSRDWTPRDKYHIEQWYKETNGVSFMDIVRTTKWIPSDGNAPVPLLSEEELAHHREFPLFSMLFSRFETLYQECLKQENGILFLTKKQQELDLITKDTSPDPDNGSYLCKWYLGKLDPNFYYSDKNDQMFLAELLNELHES